MFPETLKIWRIAGALVLGGAILASSAWMIVRNFGVAPAPAVAAAAAPETAAVSAMGRFEPMEPITRVGAPYIQGQPPIVAKIEVAEGQHVQAGQLLAVIAGKAQLAAAVKEAQARVAMEQIKLQETIEGPRKSVLTAQQAEVARWQAALRTDEAEVERYETLRRTHDVSASDLDAKRNQMENAEQMLAAAKAQLAGLTERHLQDVQSAQDELNLGRAQVDHARANLASADVHAPASGIILHVRALPGEQVGPQGIVELARTAQMDVLAEVYETDIGRLKMGEQAEVTSPLLPPGTRLAGTVVAIGSQVGRAGMAAADNATFADARVVMVRVRLAQSAPAAKLIDGKAAVVFQP
jgi:HlyD family secretion protein